MTTATANRAYRIAWKDVPIELLNEAGQVVVTYIIRRAWVCEYTPPGLAAGADSAAIESITLAHEGWERTPASKSYRAEDRLTPTG